MNLYKTADLFETLPRFNEQLAAKYANKGYTTRMYDLINQNVSLTIRQTNCQEVYEDILQCNGTVLLFVMLDDNCVILTAFGTDENDNTCYVQFHTEEVEPFLLPVNIRGSNIQTDVIHINDFLETCPTISSNECLEEHELRFIETSFKVTLDE